MSKKTIIEEYEKALRAEAEPGVPRWLAWVIRLYFAASLIATVAILAAVIYWSLSL